MVANPNVSLGKVVNHNVSLSKVANHNVSLRRLQITMFLSALLQITIFLSARLQITMFLSARFQITMFLIIIKHPYLVWYCNYINWVKVAPQTLVELFRCTSISFRIKACHTISNLQMYLNEQHVVPNAVHTHFQIRQDVETKF